MAAGERGEGAATGRRLGTNPLLWLGVILLLGRSGLRRGFARVAATAAACSWLPLGDLGAGYFAWLGSMGLLTAGGTWCATQPAGRNPLMLPSSST